MRILVITAVNLYEEVESADLYVLYNCDRYMRDFAFNKKKLMLHLASMEYYGDILRRNGLKIKWVESWRELEQTCSGGEVVCYDQVDNKLNAQLLKLGKKGKPVTMLESRNFLLTREELEKFGKKSIAAFYRFVQKKIGIMFGKSYDQENRKALPADIAIPGQKAFSNQYLRKAAKRVNQEYADNYGNTNNFFFPVTHQEAKEQLNFFLKKKLENFGEFQDAIDGSEDFVFHSNLSSSLNTGLLDVRRVVKEVNERKTALNNKEGFLRQVLGWREYCRFTYCKFLGVMNKEAFLAAEKGLNEKFYSGSTGIGTLDWLIVKMRDNAYCHHIERLVLGSFFQTLQVKKSEAFRWFMEMQIDSYEWAMVYNMCMIYYSGTFLTTKPYLFSSQYIKRMSTNIEFSGEELARIDALYWGFVEKNKKKIKRVYRLAQQVKYLKKHKEDVGAYKKILNAVFG